MMLQKLEAKEDTEASLFERNMSVLRRMQPELETKLRQAPEDPSIETAISRTGQPVPIMRGKPINSADDPVAEAAQIFRGAMADAVQQRLIVFGFGFGYHLYPFVKAGFSPIVIEPSAAMLKRAMSTRDLRDMLPYLHFHVGDMLPDIPRGTNVMAVPAYLTLYPSQAERLSGKINKDNPARTDDIVQGTYYGAYRNVTCLKNPCDWAVYQMLLFLIRPTLIIEIGACRGGSAMWFADILRLMGGERRIHTYDVVDEGAPEMREDPMITYHLGGHATFDPGIIRPDDRVFIIEDSAHTYENTLEVLHKFAGYVSPNSYFVVEDGAAGFTRPQLHGGPIKAIEEFMATDNRYVIDERWEHFYGSKNSNCLKGFLRRKV
jgi:cephalosporin hydroxylase